LKSGISKEAMRKRGEMVERSFAHILDRGGMRRAWLRGRENVHKRYLIHVAGFNLGILMRAIFGQGTPREAASARSAIVLVVQAGSAPAIAVISVIDGEAAMLAIIIAPETA
jgi:transposase